MRCQVMIVAAVVWGGMLAGGAVAQVSQPATTRAAAERVPAIVAAGVAPVSLEVMTQVHEAVKTPFKFGVVIAREGEEWIDCPSVYRFNDHWFMMYVMYTPKIGYETMLAQSEDLLHWKKLGKILPFRNEGWDAYQADGGISLVDTAWGGSMMPEKYDGKYWASYIGGNLKGMEPDPLSTGIAWTTTPDKAAAWERIAENPVLSGSDADARFWEKTTIFKTSIIRDPKERLGAPFVAYYNARSMKPGPEWTSGKEAIGMAVSKDMIHWKRFGPEEPLVVDPADKATGISGDPQLVRMEVAGKELWVMFYFGYRWGPDKGAFDTFAASYDLLHWTKWRGEQLITVAPQKPAFDDTFAHKPWVLKHEGVVYHFYCSVGEGGRQIAVATSREMKKE